MPAFDLLVNDGNPGREEKNLQKRVGDLREKLMNKQINVIGRRIIEVRHSVKEGIGDRMSCVRLDKTSAVKVYFFLSRLMKFILFLDQ